MSKKRKDSRIGLDLDGIIETLRSGIQKEGSNFADDDSWIIFLQNFKTIKKLREIKIWEGTTEGGGKTTFVRLSKTEKEKLLRKYRDMQKAEIHKESIKTEMEVSNVPAAAIIHYMNSFNEDDEDNSDSHSDYPKHSIQKTVSRFNKSSNLCLNVKTRQMTTKENEALEKIGEDTSENQNDAGTFMDDMSRVSLDNQEKNEVIGNQNIVIWSPSTPVNVEQQAFVNFPQLGTGTVQIVMPYNTVYPISANTASGQNSQQPLVQFSHVMQFSDASVDTRDLYPDLTLSSNNESDPAPTTQFDPSSNALLDSSLENDDASKNTIDDKNIETNSRSAETINQKEAEEDKLEEMTNDEYDQLWDPDAEGWPRGGPGKHGMRIVVENIMKGELVEMTANEMEYTPDRCFSVVVSAEDMPYFFDSENEEFVKYKWPGIVRKSMMKSIHKCPVRADKTVYMPTEKNRHLYFAKIIMSCKCSMHFYLFGFEEPKVKQDYVLFGRSTGEFRLQQNQKIFPEIRGRSREIFKDQLKNESALKVYRDFLCSLPDDYLLHCGPLDNVLAVFRNLKSEGKNEGRRHHNVLEDLKLLATSFENTYDDPNLKGFVHQITEKSNKFYLHLAEQLMFAAAINSNLELEPTFYFDMTGTTTDKLENDQRKPLYGALLLKAQQLNTLPVSECISSVNKAVDLTNFFLRVLSDLRLCSGNRKAQPNVIVIDNSDASISAILLAWNHQDLTTYVNMCFEIFDESSTPFPSDKTALVLCIGHLMKSFRSNICSKTTDSNKAHQVQRNIAMYAIARFVEVENKKEFERVTLAVMKIFGMKSVDGMEQILDEINFLKTDKAASLLNFLNEALTEEIVSNEDGKEPIIPDGESKAKGTKGSIRSQSKFYQFFSEIRLNFTKKLDDEPLLNENWYYNPSILEVIQNYTSKFPLWNTSVIRTKKGLEHLYRATTGIVEAYFKNEKRVVHPKRPMRAAKFVEDHFSCVMGVLKHERAKAIANNLVSENFMNKLNSKVKSDDKEFHEQEEEWNKKTQDMLAKASKNKEESKRLTSKDHLILLNQYAKRSYEKSINQKTRNTRSTKTTDKNEILEESEDDSNVEPPSTPDRPANIPENSNKNTSQGQENYVNSTNVIFPSTTPATISENVWMLLDELGAVRLPIDQENQLRSLKFNDHLVESRNHLPGLTVKLLSTLSKRKEWVDARVLDHLAKIMVQYSGSTENQIVVIPHEVLWWLQFNVGGEWIEGDLARQAIFQNITSETNVIYYILFVGNHFVLVKYKKFVMNQWSILVFDPMENYTPALVKNGVDRMSQWIASQLMDVASTARVPTFSSIKKMKIPGGDGRDCGPGVAWVLERELENMGKSTNYKNVKVDLDACRTRWVMQILHTGTLGKLIIDKGDSDGMTIRKIIGWLDDHLISPFNDEEHVVSDDDEEV